MALGLVLDPFLRVFWAILRFEFWDHFVGPENDPLLLTWIREGRFSGPFSRPKVGAANLFQVGAQELFQGPFCGQQSGPPMRGTIGLCQEVSGNAWFLWSWFWDPFEAPVLPTPRD